MVVSKIDPYNKEENELPLNKLAQLDMLERLQKAKEQGGQTRSIGQLLEETNPYERGMAVVAQALSKAGATASFTKTFDQKVKSEMEKELADLKEDALENIDDKAMLSRIAQGLQRKKDLKGDSDQAGVRSGMPTLDQETSDLLQLYLRTYANLIATDSPLIKKKIDEMEQRLMSKGLTEGQLLSLKLSLKNSLRGEVVVQIKDAFLKRALTQDMIVEWGLNTRSLNNILDNVWNNDQLGGKEFGGYRNDLQGAMDHVVDEGNRELRTFLTEALKAKMTERLVGNNEKIPQELKDLLQVAGRIGFDLNKYVVQWQQDKINEGLFIFNKPQEPMLFQDQQDQQRKKFQPPEETTEELLLNRLRALYLRKALKDDWLTSINTDFKIRRTKNGLLRLGIYSNDVNEQVKSEALTIARLKLMEMIKETLLERATLYRLEGPAYSLLNKKMTGLLRNAKRLEMNITEYDFNALRDNADLMVFEVSKRELRLTVIAGKATGAPQLQIKKQKLVQLLRRLKEEANIDEDLGLDEDDERDSLQLSA